MIEMEKTNPLPPATASVTPPSPKEPAQDKEVDNLGKPFNSRESEWLKCPGCGNRYWKQAQDLRKWIGKEEDFICNGCASQIEYCAMCKQPFFDKTDERLGICTDCMIDFDIKESIKHSPDASTSSTVEYAGGAMDKNGRFRIWKNGRVANGNGKSYDTDRVIAESQPVKKTFTSDLSDFRVKECGVCTKTEPKVRFEWNLWYKLNKLMRDLDHEWLAYLIGEKVSDDEFNVRDAMFPQQEVGYGACENLEAQPEGTVGIVHSHHTMFAEHSGIDDNGIDQQNFVSVVLSTKGYSATVKRDTACGHFIILKAKVEVFPPNIDITEWADAAKAKMKKVTYTYTYPQKQDNLCGYWGS